MGGHSNKYPSCTKPRPLCAMYASALNCDACFKKLLNLKTYISSEALKQILFPIVFYLVIFICIHFFPISIHDNFLLGIILYIIPVPIIIIFFLSNLVTTILDDRSFIVPTLVHFFAGVAYVLIIL